MKTEKDKLSQLKSDITDCAKKNGLSVELRTKNMKERDKKVGITWRFASSTSQKIDLDAVIKLHVIKTEIYCVYNRKEIRRLHYLHDCHQRYLFFKVNNKTFHGAGMVVPVDKNEVGYREVPETQGNCFGFLY